MEAERILLVRTGGLGDSVLMWPAVSALRRRFGRAEIDLMGHASRLQTLVVPGGADRACDVEGSGLHRFYELEADLPAEVAARFNTYSVVVAFTAPGDHTLAENLSACGVREVHAFLPFPPPGARIHAAEHVRQALIEVGLAERGPVPVLPVSDGELRSAQAHLARAGCDRGSLALLAPGSGSPAKNWPAAHFARLAERLLARDLQVGLLQGPADERAVAALQAELDSALPVLADASPVLLKGLCASAALLVGNDAGPCHLAALLGTPTVAIFSRTDPAIWHPLGPAAGWLGPEPEGVVSVQAAWDACQRYFELDLDSAPHRRLS
ncbi:MAG: glycosyltransferase family 9 protein [Deltaproteobacteria bacterium]|nr:glycosyltransferase family 9 protein [Deltaproteobacteria bacterium]